MDLSVGGEFFSGRRVLGVTEHCCQGAAPVHGQTLRIIVWTSSSSLSSWSPSSSSSRSSSYNGVASLARAQWSDCGLMSGHYTQPTSPAQLLYNLHLLFNEVPMMRRHYYTLYTTSHNPIIHNQPCTTSLFSTKWWGLGDYEERWLRKGRASR